MVAVPFGAGSAVWGGFSILITMAAKKGAVEQLFQSTMCRISLALKLADAQQRLHPDSDMLFNIGVLHHPTPRDDDLVSTVRFTITQSVLTHHLQQRDRWILTSNHEKIQISTRPTQQFREASFLDHASIAILCIVVHRRMLFSTTSRQ